MNILYLTNELNYTDGVSSHLFYLLTELINKKKLKIFLMCGGGDAVEKFKNMGLKIIVNKNINHKHRSLKKFSSSILSVYKFAKENKIQIIHSQNHYAANIAYQCSKFLKVQTVQTIHGIIPNIGRLKHFAANDYIVVNKHIYEHLKSKNIAEAKNIHLIYNAIDFNFNIIKKKSDKVKIITSARLESGKGIDTFIKAVSKLPVEYKNKAEFLLAGEGSLEKELKDLNKKLRAGFIFLGRQDNLRKLLNDTHIFVIPSEAEGLPMILLEAAASKNLIVSSDFKGIEFILKNGEEGLVFKINNEEDLLEKIKIAIDNPGLSKKLAEKFYNSANILFNLNTMIEKYLTIYSKILKA